VWIPPAAGLPTTIAILSRTSPTTTVILSEAKDLPHLTGWYGRPFASLGMTVWAGLAPEIEGAGATGVGPTRLAGRAYSQPFVGRTGGRVQSWFFSPP
jgi:hypothetical protein